jgi:hypothetical protein
MKPMGATDGLNAASEALEILERYEQTMVAFDADTSPTTGLDLRYRRRAGDHRPGGADHTSA